MAPRSALALLLLVVVGCAPAASSPTPTVTVAPSASATPQPPTPSATLPGRLQPSNVALPAVAGALVLFQLPAENGLHGISFGAEAEGLIGGQAPQNTALATWSQSPYGVPFIVGTTAYGRGLKELGTIPWSESARAFKTWSSDGRFLCAAVPERPATGAQMRLEMAAIG